MDDQEFTSETSEPFNDSVGSDSPDITYNVTVIFMLGVMVGIMVFRTLSARWHA